MSQASKQEYFRIMHGRYQRARSDEAKSAILDELCEVYGYHRKHVIRKLNRPLVKRKPSVGTNRAARPITPK